MPGPSLGYSQNNFENIFWFYCFRAHSDRKIIVHLQDNNSSKALKRGIVEYDMEMRLTLARNNS